MTGGANVQQLGLSTYKLGCKLVGGRIAKSCLYLLSDGITESQFADDAELQDTSLRSFL